jgi:hypothetical protein
VILLVTDFIFEGPVVGITIALTSSLFLGLWFVLGLVRRLSNERSRDG